MLVGGLVRTNPFSSLSDSPDAETGQPNILSFDLMYERVPASSFGSLYCHRVSLKVCYLAFLLL